MKPARLRPRAKDAQALMYAVRCRSLGLNTDAHSEVRG